MFNTLDYVLLLLYSFQPEMIINKLSDQLTGYLDQKSSH
jgi:hypothetical protein